VSDDQAAHIARLSHIYGREEGGEFLTSAKSAARVVRRNIKDVDDSAHEAVDVPEMATVVGAHP
jgi:hypothetical protein